MLKVAQALTADTSSSSEVELSLIGTEDLFSNKALHNNLRSGQHIICSIVNKQPTEIGLRTDIERQRSSELCDASPKKDHEAGASDPRKEKIEDTEDGEAHEGAALLAPTIHHKVQPNARSHQIWATSQQKTKKQGQDVDEMDIDSTNKDEEGDSNL